MTCLKSTIPASDSVVDVHALPRPLSTQALLEFEHAVIGALTTLGREMFGLGLGMASHPAASRPDAAEVEYASWMPGPGAIEVDSWAASLRATRR